MAAPVLIRHPVFESTVREVPAKSVKEWTDQGWVRVASKDEAKVRATTPGLIPQ